MYHSYSTLQPTGKAIISDLYRYSVSTAKPATRLGWLFLDMALNVVMACASANATRERDADACAQYSLWGLKFAKMIRLPICWRHIVF